MFLAALCSALVLTQDSAGWRQYATPEEAGFSAERLAAAWEFADQAGSAAVFAVYRGYALLAWGEVERRYECHSVRKSLMNALVGLAVAQGALALDDTLAELGIDDLQPLSEVEKRATVTDLLGARSGVYHPAAKEPSDMRAERPARGSHAPGEFFHYNNWDFNVLGTLFERATKSTVATAFLERLARPLGMQDFRAQDVFAELTPSYSRFPAHAFRMSARDLARFGELYRKHGAWNGRELLPASWIERSTTPHEDSAEGRGYGFLWWTYRAGSLAAYPHLNAHDLFAARGTGGQFLLVAPGAELVFVHRGDTDNEREVNGPDCWGLAEQVLAAQTGAAREAPRLGELRVERFTHPLPARPDHAPVAVAPEVFATLAAEYAYPGFRVRVFVHEGRLFAHRDDGEEEELLPLSEMRYALFSNAYEIEFERDATGRAQTARLSTPRGALTGTRVDMR
ncbi:MAG: class C beta-lactamase-related serine hydrolase [Planctomycetes bacterium]|nr:class C beta-lactamase-related serine hydrolase [Planctomycetota bacterium]